jgi:4-hydroxy-4-methyl-2-oxoglutarate aldolase
LKMPVGFRVHTQVARPDPTLVKRFAALFSPDISDVINRAGTMENAVRPMYLPMKRIAGPAVTTSVPTGAFNVIKAGMQQTRAGDVLVVNGRGSLNGALFGSNVCRGLLHRGVAGLIVDGAVRDVSEIQTDGLPVFARGASAGMASIEGTGEVNVPIACGGVVVNPGDIIVADEDGIVVVRPDDAEYVLSKVVELKAKHNAVQPVLLRGEVTNIANIEKTLREQGCEFI